MNRWVPSATMGNAGLTTDSVKCFGEGQERCHMVCAMSISTSWAMLMVTAASIGQMKLFRGANRSKFITWLMLTVYSRGRGLEPLQGVTLVYNSCPACTP